MKKVKTRYRKTDDGEKKSILKFRDYEEEEENDESSSWGSSKKRRKDIGKRLHRKKTMKDDFGFSSNEQ